LNEKIHAHLRHAGGYKFDVTFDEWDEGKVEMDEPAPLGAGDAPNAGMMLSSAVGHCLSASLIFCLQKSRVIVGDVTTDVETTLTRNERGRWRIEGIKVKLKPSVDEPDLEKLERCLGMFEDFCIVTASVREGIQVDVEVERD